MVKEGGKEGKRKLGNWGKRIVKKEPPTTR